MVASGQRDIEIFFKLVDFSIRWFRLVRAGVSMAEETDAMAGNGATNEAY